MEYLAGQYDVLVIGAGHAGIEAALAAARLGCKTAVFTINMDGCFNAGPGRPAGWAHCGGCPVTERPPRQRRAAGDEPCVPFQFW